MTKFILSVVAVTLSVGVAVAGPGGKGSSGSHQRFPSNGSHMSSNYHPSSNHWRWSNGGFQKTFPSNFGGKSFSHGFYFPGRSWNHWSYHCYWPKYGCQCYWCPTTSCWYYWCPPDDCYYPVDYCPYHIYSW